MAGTPQSVLEAQAMKVKEAKEKALADRMAHGLAEATLTRDRGMRAIAIKAGDLKATVQVIEAKLAQEFMDRDNDLMKLYETYMRAGIEADYQSDLLSVFKLTYRPE